MMAHFGQPRPYAICVVFMGLKAGCAEPANSPLQHKALTYCNMHDRSKDRPTLSLSQLFGSCWSRSALYCSRRTFSSWCSDTPQTPHSRRSRVSQSSRHSWLSCVECSWNAGSSSAEGWWYRTYVGDVDYRRRIVQEKLHCLALLNGQLSLIHLWRLQHAHPRLSSSVIPCTLPLNGPLLLPVSCLLT